MNMADGLENDELWKVSDIQTTRLTGDELLTKEDTPFFIVSDDRVFLMNCVYSSHIWCAGKLCIRYWKHARRSLKTFVVRDYSAFSVPKMHIEKHSGPSAIEDENDVLIGK